MSYTVHLSKDKKFKKLVEASEPFELRKRKDLTVYLCASIMSQQLSVKVADVIYSRFLDLYNGKAPSAAQIVATAPETLRSIGLSNAKVTYVQNVARFSLEQGLDLKTLSRMSDEEVIVYLTQIKGVGKWTAEMLLMFALGREDVFSIDDLGLQNAMIKIYKLNREDKKAFREKLLSISAKWSPYRTYACLHLWHYKDNTPIK